MADSTDNPISASTTATADASAHQGGWSIYKSGQGYYTRMGTVVGVSIVSLLGILWMWDIVKNNLTVSGVNPLYVATAAALLVGGLITGIMYYLVFVKPKSVDFLIATEGEMKKVNWSTRREVVGSTGAVIVTAIVIALFCYGIDRAFFWFFAQIKVLDI